MKNKGIKVTTVFISIVIFIAGLADLKYKGKFYQLLPKDVQSKVDTFIN